MGEANSAKVKLAKSKDPAIGRVFCILKLFNC